MSQQAGRGAAENTRSKNAPREHTRGAQHSEMLFSTPCKSFGKGNASDRDYGAAVEFSPVYLNTLLGSHGGGRLTNASALRVKLFQMSWELFVKPLLLSLLINQDLIHLSYIISRF